MKNHLHRLPRGIAFLSAFVQLSLTRANVVARNEKSLCKEGVSQKGSEQQVGGAFKDGKRFTRICEPNQLQLNLRDTKNKSMKKKERTR
jgi:hypothetical protein